MAGAVVAIGLAVATWRPVRMETCGYLRTLGLTRWQARQIMLLEVLPPVGVAVGAGAAAGALLPVLLAPALGLAQLTT